MHQGRLVLSDQYLSHRAGQKSLHIRLDSDIFTIDSAKSSPRIIKTGLMLYSRVT